MDRPLWFPTFTPWSRKEVCPGDWSRGVYWGGNVLGVSARGGVRGRCPGVGTSWGGQCPGGVLGVALGVGALGTILDSKE